MRLFLGLPLAHQSRRDILQVGRRLERWSVKGSFAPAANYHLTLVFLGEQPPERLAPAFAALEAVALPPLTLTLTRLSSFPGGIWYLAPRPCSLLTDAQGELTEALRREGFAPEYRPFVPHVTLGRRIRLREDVPLPSLLPAPIQARTGPPRLFLSHRVDGALTYTPLEEGEQGETSALSPILP